MQETRSAFICGSNLSSCHFVIAQDVPRSQFVICHLSLVMRFARHLSFVIAKRHLSCAPVIAKRRGSRWSSPPLQSSAPSNRQKRQIGRVYLENGSARSPGERRGRWWQAPE